MKHKNVRRIAAVAVFFLLWAGVEASVRYFTEPVAQAWPTIREERMAVEGSFDTVFVGASLFRNGIVPAVFDQATGRHSFNYATSSQSMELSYYALEDMAQTNPLKLALIDISVNRLLSDDGDAVHIAKYVVLSHMVNQNAKLQLLRGCFTLDEVPFLLFHSARDQLHFFWGTLSERMRPEFFREFLKRGYMPDETYPSGSMGFTPSDGRNPAGGVPAAAVPKPSATAQEDTGGFEQLARAVRQCRENGITPVLVSMPTTDAYLLSYDWYEALEAPVKALAQRENALYLDFNLSKFRVEALNDQHFTDARHLNSEGAELSRHCLRKWCKRRWRARTCPATSTILTARWSGHRPRRPPSDARFQNPRMA